MSDNKDKPSGGHRNWMLPPFPVLDTVDPSEETVWNKKNPYVAVTRCGGYPFPNPEYNGHLVENWPHFNGKPLPFFAQVVLTPTQLALVFLDDRLEGSWQPENGANAVLIVGSGIIPRWTEIKPLGRHTPDHVSMRFAAEDGYGCPAWMPSAVPSAPHWLHSGEQPEDSRLVLEIPSRIDGGDIVNIGHEYGTAYVFVSNDNKRGWLIWQS